MKAVDLPQPTLLLRPFCYDPVDPLDPTDTIEKNRHTIPKELPVGTLNPQQASLKDGFPKKTQGSPDDSKLPPERADFNGLGYLTTTYDFFYQAGGTFTFNSTIATAIGGYPLGARLWHTNDGGVSMILRSTKDDNEDDFTQDESYIGTSWVVETFIGTENNSISLLDYKFSDKTINNMSWLLADGSWCAGSTYSNVMLHLKEDIAFMPTNTPSIVVGTNSDFTAGTYTRSSGDDEVDSGTTYYAWKYSSDVFYVTVDIDAMTGAEAFEALQGQRIYKKDGSFVTTVHKVCKITTQNDGTNDFTVYVGSDGHLIVDVDDLSSVDTVYGNTGVAWYYILDVTNNRFKLPRTKWGFVGSRGNVGKYVEAGIPAHTHTGTTDSAGSHTHKMRGGASGQQYHTAVVTTGSGTFNSLIDLEVTGSHTHDISITSTNGNCYGNSTTVQPPATEMYLYFYVGIFNETAVEQTAGINASLFNTKADIDFSNIASSGKELAVSWGMPDYNSGVSVSATDNTVYSATKDGVFIISINQANASVCCYIQLLDSNDNVLLNTIGNESHYQQSWGSAASVVLPVSKGEKIKIVHVSGAVQICAFFQMKGV